MPEERGEGTKMKGGYAGRLLFVDLTEEKTEARELPTRLQEDYLGGSGLGTRLLYDMTGPETDPLGPGNVLIFMTGPFTGTKVPTSGRHQILAKSPLTGLFGEGDAGGRWGAALKGAKWDGIVVTGAASRPLYLLVAGDAVRLVAADDLWGRDTFETEKILVERHGATCRVAAIGPAGERKTPLAAIVHDGADARVVGRCGLGAVMGSKRLKALAVIATEAVHPLDEAGLRTDLRERLPLFVENAKGLHLLGTAGGVPGAEKLGDLPLKNWTQGGWDRAEAISGQKMASTILTGRFYCASCPIGCGRTVTLAEGPYGGVAGAGPEYETLGMLGASCLVSDLEAVTYAADICNRCGMDTIETGNAVAMAMEWAEKGILSPAELEGLDLRWGNAGAMVELVRRISRGETFLGRLLGQGVAAAARSLGRGLEAAIHCKGLSFPAHDPRCFNSLALGYATSNRGACHLQGGTYMFEKTALLPELGYDRPQDRHGVAGKGRLNFDAQNVMALFDSLKLCKFLLYAGATLTDVRRWLALVTGRELSLEELMRTGERLFNLKRLYNVRCGISRDDDVLPDRIVSLPRRDEGTGDNLPPLATMLDEYYACRGWDARGIPTRERLLVLGLAAEAATLGS